MSGDVQYGDEHPVVSLDARVHGDVDKQDWLDVGDAFAWIGGFFFWLAISLSLPVFGALLLLIAPRAADALDTRSRERVGPTIAIGIAIAIVLPLVGIVAAVTLRRPTPGVGIGLPCCRSSPSPTSSPPSRSAGAWSGPRAIACWPSWPGFAILRLVAFVPILGLLVGLAAVVFGLGLIGAAIGAAREPRTRTRLEPRAAEHRDRRVARVAGSLARALAEREDRAAGVGDQPLVAAAVAEAVAALRHA